MYNWFLTFHFHRTKLRHHTKCRCTSAGPRPYQAKDTGYSSGKMNEIVQTVGNLKWRTNGPYTCGYVQVIWTDFQVLVGYYYDGQTVIKLLCSVVFVISISSTLFL